MENVVLIILTGFAILGVYYVVQVFTTPAHSYKTRAAVVLPFVEDESEMVDAVFYAMQAYPISPVVICGTTGTVWRGNPSGICGRAIALRPEELPAYFEQFYHLQSGSHPI